MGYVKENRQVVSNLPIDSSHVILAITQNESHYTLV